jgi:hypothetical protein
MPCSRLIRQLTSVSGALYGYFWQIRKDRVRIPSAMRDFSLTGWALRLGRRSAAVQEEFSGDRDELLPPPMKGQSGISAGVETLRDGALPRPTRFRRSLALKTRFDCSLMCAQFSLAGGVDNSYFAL